MRRNKIIAGVSVLLTLLVTVDVANAFVVKFGGTRDQVRSACASSGGELVEGKDHTVCLGETTGVACWDDGECIGTGPRTASYGVRVPFGMGNSAPVASPVKRIPPIGTWHVPQSLVEAGTDSTPAPTPAPSGDATGGASDLPAPIL